MHPRRAVGLGDGMSRHRSASPRMKASLRHAEHACHRGNRKHRLVRTHELEDPDAIVPVSRANQAAARERMSRSSRSCLFSRRTVPARHALQRSARHPSPPGGPLPVGLCNPVADRLRCRLKLAGKLGRITPSANQIDHPATKLRKRGQVRLGHLKSLR